MYSPTSASISSLSSGGCVYWLRFTSGVRKHETITPFTSLTGYVCGTPSTTTGRPLSERRSQTRGTCTERELANVSAS